MADAAVRAKTGFVRVIVLVTAVTILRGIPETGQSANVQVTHCTIDFVVLTSQLEGSGIMIEASSEPVDPIVAIQAARAKGGQMCLGKG